MPAFLRWLLVLLPLNPVCVRIVQNASRRPRHLYLRASYLFVLIAAILIILLTTGGKTFTYQSLASNAATAFQYLAYLQVTLICFLTPVFMASAIAQEANPKTWDVILTTPLSPLQLVLGNLFGRLFFILALLFSALPLFAITQYFGGVPGRTIFLAFVVTAGAALVVGAIAISLSVNRLAGKRAVFAFYVSVISYLGVTFAIDIPLRGTTPWDGVTLMTPINPFLTIQALLDPVSYPRPDVVQLAEMGPLRRFYYGNPVGAWIAISGGLSLVLIAVSSLTVRSVASSAGSRLGWKRRTTAASSRRIRPPKTVWHNPIAWREASARQATLGRIITRWTFVGLGALWGLIIVAFYHTGSFDSTQFRFALTATVWTELIVITLIAVNMSATAISKEREDGTLDLLLTTPITPADYLNGKLRGLVTALLPLLAVPIGSVAIASIYTLLGGFGRNGGVTVTQALPVSNTPTIDMPVVLPEAAFVMPITTIPFIAFAVMVGLQWSLKSKGTISSVVSTVAVVGVIASIAGLCGWQAGLSVPVVGPVLTAINPLTLSFALINPVDAMPEPLASSNGITTTRIALSAGAIVAVGIYAAIIYGIHATLNKTFDMTVRKLAGTS